MPSNQDSITSQRFSRREKTSFHSSPQTIVTSSLVSVHFWVTVQKWHKKYEPELQFTFRLLISNNKLQQLHLYLQYENEKGQGRGGRSLYKRTGKLLHIHKELSETFTSLKSEKWGRKFYLLPLVSAVRMGANDCKPLPSAAAADST